MIDVIRVRRAAVSDIPVIFFIRTAVRENLLTVAELAAIGVTPESVAALLLGDTAAGWVGMEGQEIVGFSIARADPGDVFALFVLPPWSGRGVGSRLLREAEQWLKARGIASGWLVTGSDAVGARRFYAHRGWQPAGPDADGQIRFTKSF